MLRQMTVERYAVLYKQCEMNDHESSTAEPEKRGGDELSLQL
jgi:hypothetical protein